MNRRDVFLRQVGLVLLMIVLSLGTAQAALVNGDFETGNLDPWTTYTTTNGTLGTNLPTVSNFDVAGSGVSSPALAVSVGYHIAPCSVPGYYCPMPTEGGGIRQSVNFSGGWISLHANVAVNNSTLYGGYNLDGGTFSLLLDGILLDTFSVGSIVAGTVQRGELDFDAFVSAGQHTIDILITRDAAECRSLTQYIDDISIVPAPEPATMLLLGLGLAGVAVARKRFRK